ncbi:MAG: DUF4296 domain-containing protein [Bacteroidota bacterium]|nr:DUF4296 domain-containing protein [Bacteroidota bacterium]
MKRFILPVLFIFTVLAFSCAGRKNKADRRDTIPEKDLIPILIDIHIADGLLSLPKINFMFSNVDTLGNYMDIVKKHGYTKDQMDRTMRYYFMRRPRKLVKIYDKVLGGISELESRISRESPEYNSPEANIWHGKFSYSFPDPSGKDTAWVDFPAVYLQAYILKFTLTLYPDDQSVDPRLGLYFVHTDSSGNEKRISFTSLPYIKDGKPHSYFTFLNMDLPAPVRLKGWFTGNECNTPFVYRHLRLQNIVLTRKIY